MIEAYDPVSVAAGGDQEPVAARLAEQVADQLGTVETRLAALEADVKAATALAHGAEQIAEAAEAAAVSAKKVGKHPSPPPPPPRQDKRLAALTERLAAAEARLAAAEEPAGLRALEERLAAAEARLAARTSALERAVGDGINDRLAGAHDTEQRLAAAEATAGAAGKAAAAAAERVADLEDSVRWLTTHLHSQFWSQWNASQWQWCSLQQRPGAAAEQ